MNDDFDRAASDRADQEVLEAVRRHFALELREAKFRLGQARQTRLESRPEPGIGLPAPQIGPPAPRTGLLTGGRALAGLAAVALVAVLGLAVLLPPANVPAASPSPSTVPASASIARAGETLPPGIPNPVSVAGTSAWVFGDAGLYVSRDAGRTWALVDLPNGVTPAAVATVAMAQDRPIWLAVREGSGCRLYRKASGDTAWSSVLLTPSWGSLAPANPGELGFVAVAPGRDGLVTVLESIYFDSTHATTSLFISTDDGASFVQRPPQKDSPANAALDSVTFATTRAGVAIAADPDTYRLILYTADGGQTWSRARVTGLPADGQYAMGAPRLVGSSIAVPVFYCEPDCVAATLQILVSADGGATFAAVGQPLKVGWWSPIGVLGSEIWVASGGTVYESADAGATWTAVPATGLPDTLDELALTGPDSAILAGSRDNCGLIQACPYLNVLVATTDGGRTWTSVDAVLPLPSAAPTR
jgi:photosystem II stability/assembly factor-like uncharacterized protein